MQFHLFLESVTLAQDLSATSAICETRVKAKRQQLTMLRGTVDLTPVAISRAPIKYEVHLATTDLSCGRGVEDLTCRRYAADKMMTNSAFGPEAGTSNALKAYRQRCVVLRNALPALATLVTSRIEGGVALNAEYTAGFVLANRSRSSNHSCEADIHCASSRPTAWFHGRPPPTSSFTARRLPSASGSFRKMEARTLNLRHSKQLGFKTTTLWPNHIQTSY